MNELEFLRQQLATEERNFAAVAPACAAALAPEREPPPDRQFLQACAAYLLSAGLRASDRDAAHAAVLAASADAGDATPGALRAALESGVAAHRAALAQLDRLLAGLGSAADAGPALAEGLGRFLASLSALPAARRHALDERIERDYGIAEWRRTALVDADAILEERELHERVADSLPDGVSLAPAELGAPTVRRSLGAQSRTTAG